MEIRDFMSIKCYENLIDVNDVEVGDKFLTGLSMTEQKEQKAVGDDISWYEVVSVDPAKGQMSYTVKFSVLKNSIQEKK